jgi:hypothetical protein
VIFLVSSSPSPKELEVESNVRHKEARDGGNTELTLMTLAKKAVTPVVVEG